MDMRDGKVGGQDWRTHGWEMGMQVIASKDAEIEDLKKRLKDATDIIKSRDDTISARDAQIAGLQSELDDLRKQLAEAKRKAAEMEADLKKSKVCVRRMRGGGRLWVGERVCAIHIDSINHAL
jgi:peptidoglycan hydrolase CwlO-like protein